MKRYFQRLGFPGPRHPVCLYLHSISPPMFPNGPGPAIFLPPDELRSALRVFSTRMRPGALAAVVADSTRRWTGPRSLALTFDDGFRDNLTTALPLLEEFDAPATIFVTTGFVDREVLPYELVLAAVLATRDELAVELPGGRRVFPVTTREEKNVAYRELTAVLKPATHESRQRFLESLAPDGSVVAKIQNLFLNWDELARLHAHPLVTIGAHTHTHLALAHQKPGIVRAEMRESRERLASQLGGPVGSFAFPYGNHDETTLALAREAGFKVAVTTRRDVVKPGADPLAVPRCELRRAAAAADFTRGIPQS